MKDYIKKITNFPLFDQISQSELASMLQCIGAFAKTFDAGNFIVLEGGYVDCVGIVITGIVHTIKEDIWGHKTIIEIIEPMQLFGENNILGAPNKSFFSLVCVEKTEVLFLPFHIVLHTCCKSCAFHHKLVVNIVSIMAQKNLQLAKKLEIATQRSLRTKILSYLSQESQKSGSKYFTVPIGRIEMAEYLCVDRCALTRVLSGMKAEGILDYSNNTFRLL